MSKADQVIAQPVIARIPVAPVVSLMLVAMLWLPLVNKHLKHVRVSLAMQFWQLFIFSLLVMALLTRLLAALHAHLGKLPTMQFTFWDIPPMLATPLVKAECES